jgi:hypothetical protein
VSGAILISDRLERRCRKRIRAGRRALGWIAAAALVVAAAARADSTAAERLPTASATIGGERFELEVARDPVAQMRGLGGRSSIDAHGGMLFVFPAAQPLAFVMRDCPIPIDVAFLDAQGRVINVQVMTPEAPRAPGESAPAYEARLRSYPSALPARFALETAGGRLTQLGVRSGDQIELDLGALTLH